LEATSRVEAMKILRPTSLIDKALRSCVWNVGAGAAGDSTLRPSRISALEWNFIRLIVFAILMTTCVSTFLNTKFRTNARQSAGTSRATEGAPTLPVPSNTASTVALSSVAAAPQRLLLCSHGRLMWFDVGTRSSMVLHEGRGVYYGTFPGKTNSSVWVVSRPHNWKPSTAVESLLEIDINSGALLDERAIPSKFAHDAIRSTSGDVVYVANTGEGSVEELVFPTMAPVRAHRLFTRKEHVNTLAEDPTNPRLLWALLHNLGQSKLVQIDLDTDRVVQQLDNVGMKAHGCVFWREWVVLLDSDRGAVVTVHRQSGDKTTLWADPAVGFLKGLSVVADVAYFGINAPVMRSQRNRPDLGAEIGAVDLLRRELVFRHPVQTQGLLNMVAAPHMAVSSTYRAIDAWIDVGGKASVGLQAGPGATEEAERLSQRKRHRLRSEDLEQLKRRVPEPTNFTHAICPECMPPSLKHLELADKQELKRRLQMTGGRSEMNQEEGSVYTMPPYELVLEEMDPESPALAKLADAVRNNDTIWTEEYQRVHNAYLDGRQKIDVRFKPGVQYMHFIFSDHSGSKNVIKYPAWYEWQPLLRPVLEMVFAKHDDSFIEHNIIRMQLARMTPNAQIKRHQDTGGWVMVSHRIHVPLIANKEVRCIRFVLECNSSNW